MATVVDDEPEIRTLHNSAPQPGELINSCAFKPL